MGMFQEIRIRIVIALRLTGVIPLLQWAKLERGRKRRKKLFVPKRIPEDTHVLVVCAYYEHPEWVKEMAASVQAQTFSNWTLVIEDDCSPRHPLKKSLSTLQLGDNIICFEAAENQGAYACRNEAIAKANEMQIPWTHLTFIDPDDLAYENWLEHALECIGGDQGVVRVVLERWDERLRKMKRRVLSHAPSIWTRTVWEQLGGFANVRVAADTELLLRAEYAQPAVSIFEGIKPAQKCRIHGGNASQTSLVQRKKWIIERERDLLGEVSIVKKKRP